MIRELRGEVQLMKLDEDGKDWTDKSSALWRQIKEKPRVPYNLNVLLEGMSLKNSRLKFIEQIQEYPPTINPGKTLYTLDKYLSLFKEQLESTEKNVLNSIGKLPITEDKLSKKKLPKGEAAALKREITRKGFESSSTKTDSSKAKREEAELEL